MKLDYYKTSEDFVKSERFTTWKKGFVETELWGQLTREYDYILDRVDFTWSEEWNTFTLPRKLIVSKFTSLMGFYFIENYLNKEEQIVDMGCGINYWKNYYDVHGVDPLQFDHAVNKYEVDITSVIGHDPFSSLTYFQDGSNDVPTLVSEHPLKNQLSFYERNRGKFKNIMSQCALHFDSDIERVLEDFYGLLGSGGKGFASLNLQRLYASDKSRSLNRQLDKLRSMEDIIEEVVVMEDPNDSPLDGNLHIIFKETA